MHFSQGNNVIRNISKLFFNQIKGKRLFFPICTSPLNLHVPEKPNIVRESDVRDLKILLFGVVVLQGKSETCKFNNCRANAKSAAETNRFPLIGLKKKFGKVTYKYIIS